MERWSCWHFNRRIHYHPTSTKAKYPSSQTEKMCLETEFESCKALVLVRPISRPAPHDLACRWKDGLVGTSIAAYTTILHRQRRSINHRKQRRCVLRRNSKAAKLLFLLGPLAAHTLACRWKDGLVGTSTAAHYHPTSTKAKYPSSQTEKMCLETEFESCKALVACLS
eukprot:scaffold320_cov108-Skeletonema_dohrnii-CCMP3373.AAC.1